MSDRHLHLERLIAAPPEEVFRYWTTPELLVTWWGPQGCQIPNYALDVRPGGRWRTTMQHSDGSSNTVSGVYLAIEAPNRVAFTWAWENETGVRGHETEVDIRLEPVPGGTRLTLRQTSFESDRARELHQSGWSSSLGCLDEAVQVAAA